MYIIVIMSSGTVCYKGSMNCGVGQSTITILKSLHVNAMTFK